MLNNKLDFDAEDGEWLQMAWMRFHDSVKDFSFKGKREFWITERIAKNFSIEPGREMCGVLIRFDGDSYNSKEAANLFIGAYQCER